MSSAPQTMTWSNNWMSGIKDDAPICEISIPGSHESCARYGGSSAHCQWRSIIDQLNRGIRFLDVRCDLTAPKGGWACSPVNESSDPEIYLFSRHGTMNQAITFEEVQAQCIAFLADNPDEFILMNVQMEQTTDGDAFARKFIEITDKYSQHWYTGNAMKIIPGFGPRAAFPAIRDVRKHIVLIRTWHNTTPPTGWPQTFNMPGEGGISWCGFNIDGLSSELVFQTQNGWSKWDGEQKGDMVEQYIQKADGWAAGGQMTLNFASYSYAAQSPGRNAAGMNKRLQEYLKGYDFSKVVGVIPIDFVSNTGNGGDSLENLIIEHQKHQKPGYSYGGTAPWLQP